MLLLSKKGVIMKLRKNHVNRKQRGKDVKNMAVFAKPLKLAFRVRQDKVEEFLAQKRNTEMLIAKFERMKTCELLSGKSKTHPDVMFLTNKIEEFRKGLKD